MSGLSVRIGLEVHAQLTSLKTKLFCSCPSDYRGKEANTNICPVCFGVPGAMPVLNREAVKKALMVALALNCRIPKKILFFRKNYFYPDMAKNFQITQYDRAGGVPLGVDGFLELGGLRVRIRRVQLEEDPAKLSYEGSIETSRETYVDYNRHGIALVEVVTEPDLTSPEEAREFLQKLSSILEHLGVCDTSLEGALRCDANISLEEGGRVEVKNISSFKDVERALKFEVTRQRSLASRGIEVRRETRHWDEVRRVTVALRRKEEEEDYRYFPEPDLVPLLTEGLVEEARRLMPELPEARAERFVAEYGLSRQVASVLVDDKSLADFFEECVKLCGRAREVASLLVGELRAYLKQADLSLKEAGVRPEVVAEVAEMVEKGDVSRGVAREVLFEALKSGRRPREVVEKRGLLKVSDPSYIGRVVDEVLRENPRAVEDALKNEKAVNYLMGLVMRKSGGRVDPAEASRILRRRLRELRHGGS